MSCNATQTLEDHAFPRTKTTSETLFCAIISQLFFPPLLPPSLCPFCSDSAAWREKVVCGKVGQPLYYSWGKSEGSLRGLRLPAALGTDMTAKASWWTQRGNQVLEKLPWHKRWSLCSLGNGAVNNENKTVQAFWVLAWRHRASSRRH